MPDFDELTPDLRAELAAVPRNREPGRLLEERTVHALRERGRLRRPRPVAAWWAAAAAVALFAAGFATGQRSSSLDIATRFAEVQQASAMRAAEQVQRTGSAYVAALAELARLDVGADEGAVLQGREAARAALRAAASELAALTPGDPVAAQMLWLLPAGGPAADSTAASKTVFWF
jgi:hypothetical protein